MASQCDCYSRREEPYFAEGDVPASRQNVSLSVLAFLFDFSPFTCLFECIAFCDAICENRTAEKEGDYRMMCFVATMIANCV